MTLSPLLRKLMTGLVGISFLFALSVVHADSGFSAVEGDLAYVVITPRSTVAAPGELVQIISSARYTNGRPQENITSCFPCPTPDNRTQGSVSYQILSGPAKMQGSKVLINADATLGSTIQIRAHFIDDVSHTSASSAIQTITVGTPALVTETESLHKAAPPVIQEVIVEEEIVEAVETEGAVKAADVVETAEPVESVELVEVAEAEETKVLTEIEETPEISESELLPAEKSMDSEDAVSANEVASLMMTNDYEVIYYAVALLLFLALAAMIAKKKLSKIDALPPEHRAKEQELYEAFGLSQHHENADRADHEKKKHEIEDAFEGQNSSLNHNQS